MTDFNKYFEAATGYTCLCCGEFVQEWDEKYFESHLKNGTCKKEIDQSE